MNQNQVKLLWGLWVCQPPPSILLAPRRCNSVCSQRCAPRGWVWVFQPCALPGGRQGVGLGGREGGQWMSEVRSRRAAGEDVSRVDAKVYLTRVTGLGCLLPSQDSSLGSIPWQVAIHSYLRSCLCLWGQGQRVLLGQQEKGKICKERVSSPSGRRAPLCLLPSNSPD